MGFRRWLEWAADEFQKATGGDNVQGKVYLAGTNTIATLYDSSAGSTTMPNPHRAHPGDEKTLTVAAAPADQTITIGSTTGFAQGDIVKIRSGTNEIERFIRSVVSGTQLQLSETIGGAFTYPIGSTVGGIDQTGSWGAFLDDGNDYEFVWRNLATALETPRKPIPIKVTATEWQDEGAVIATRTKADFRGAGVTVTDDAPGSRVRITIPGADEAFVGIWLGRWGL